jgi:hypothetical protein
MLLPHDRLPEGLREAVLEFASARGFTQVDFPLESLSATPAVADSPDVPAEPPAT